MKFKTYLKEMEGVPEQDPNVVNALSDIKKIINTMSSDEINNFGSWLYDSIYDDGDEYDNYEDDDYDSFDLDEVIEMVISLDSDDIQYVRDVLVDANELDDDEIANTGVGNVESDYDYDDDYDDDEITEKKFFKVRKRQLDREKKHNISQRRKDKKLRRREYRKNRAKIRRKQAKYRRKVKRNPNMVRHHRE